MSQLLASSSGSSLPLTEIVLVAAPVLTVLILLIAVFSGGGERRRMAQRLRRVTTDPNARRRDSEAVISVRRSDQLADNRVVDYIIRRLLPRPDALRSRLARAGLRMSLGSYLMLCLAVGAVFFGLGELSGVIPTAAAILEGVFAGIMLPHLVVSFLSARRRNRFINNFPEAIDLMVRGLKSGLPISESIRIAAEEVVDPVGSELRQVVNAVQLGSPLDEVLWDTAKRLDLQEFKFFTVALSIQNETGGNLAETLANLSDVLRGRRQLKLKIKALSSEAKASAYIIGSLPFVMSLFIFMVNPEYILDLTIDPRGVIMIIGGLVSFAVGAGVMYKMVKFEI